MRVLGSAVLAMEFFIMGFAMLIAKDTHETSTIVYGAVFMFATIFTIRLLKKRTGWILGSLLQAMLMGYSVVVPSMAIVNVIFVGLWIAAYVVGKKGEAARAALLAKGPDNS
jgi:cellulose synthase/poly-beta-1,6-N-acetylglucosamine synthase-like glycosyltransferase